MSKENDLWRFVASRMSDGESLILLVVAKSSGSSPGRAGYKMMVAEDGQLCGSIGGGVMEVALADTAKLRIENGELRIRTELVEQVHQKNSPNSSGMICSGRQTVILRQLTADDAKTIDSIIAALENKEPASLAITQSDLTLGPPKGGTPIITFEKFSENNFVYIERLGPKNDLYIVGGGHCSLALSELMSKMDFCIRIFDDRPDLNTIGKNKFADEISIVNSYQQIGELIPSGSNVYVVVMTLGYKSDEIVIRALLDKDLKYFGVLGSMAKMKTLLTSLAKDGVSKEKLARIHAPIGLSINSRTPEEIAVSIAAEIIAVKNAD